MPGTTKARIANARSAVLCGAVMALGLPGAASAASGPAAPAADEPPPLALSERPRWPAVEDLYEPGVVARNAYVNRRVGPRRLPTLASKRIGRRIELLTEDRTTEVVLVLARTTDAEGRTWLQVRSPTRPNGTVGWVPGDALGTMHRVSTWLKIDVDHQRLELVRDREVVFRARVGVGTRRWPTPRGEFYIRNRLYGPSLGPIYGPVAFSTSARSDVLTDWPGGGVVGIHGTNQPGLLPGRVSHGCVRMRNADITKLAKMLSVGTPVTIG